LWSASETSLTTDAPIDVQGEQMEPKRLFRILSRTVVNRLLRVGPSFGEFLGRHLVPKGPVRRFPNGAVEIDEDRVGDELLQVFVACGNDLNWALEGAGIYPPIGPFSSDKMYCIQYTKDYQELMKSEVSFSAGRGRYRPPSPGEYDLDRLEVIVAFRRKPPRAARRAFAAAIADWSRAASERGAFNDGPIALASPSVSFNNVRAWFQIDARRSGQDTLNWLALAILDFGEDTHTLTDVDFGEDPKIVYLNVGPISGDIFEVSFAEGHPEETISGPSGPSPHSHVPPEAKRAVGVKSGKFTVLALPYDEWDSFTAAIYFGRPFQHDERERLAKLLDAWLVLAAYGGMGGGHCGYTGTEIAFNEATDSATIRTDMGDVNPRVALKILIKSLEGYEMSGPTIEAVVFGKTLLEE
jgi:hypothetical protein